ncbi:MAG: acyl--CoA ligase [Alphaproteobacteria bacterium]|nr:acyl--CoA ligase [Alphaproteobacteria bacterium]
MESVVLGERDPAVERPAIRNVAELIFRSRRPDDEQDVVILGCSHPPDLRTVRIDLRALRHHVLAIVDAMEARGVSPGQTVALLRFPRTNETMTALAYLALSAWGVRVLLPMYVELETLPEWLAMADVTHVLASFEEVEAQGIAEDVALARKVAELVDQAGLPSTCLSRDLALQRCFDSSFDASPPDDHPRVLAMIEGTSLDTESLLLTTSGTSGRSKMVRYTQGGYLRSCVSWERAGFFDRSILGGRCLNLLLGHSMGLRALWNAVWTRVPVCLITPEWFAEHPEHVAQLLLEMKPEHVTGGPTVFGLVLQMFEGFPELAVACAPRLRCLVSSGAAFDPELDGMVQQVLGLSLHNALGLTETMQVTSTLVGGSPPSLGQPLPGVRIRLTRDETLPDEAWRLAIQAPFGFCGYVGHPDPGEWFETGDLVERLPDGTFQYLGRERWDYVKDSVGVKLSRARIHGMYEPLPEGISGIEVVALAHAIGLGALVFAPGADEAAKEGFRAHVAACLGRAKVERDEFECRHMAVHAIAFVDAELPLTRKGNVSHAKVTEAWADELASLRLADPEVP